MSRPIKMFTQLPKALLVAGLLALAPAEITRQTPGVTLTPSTTQIVIAVPECEVCQPSKSLVVDVAAKAVNMGSAPLLYTYSVTGGRLSGAGANVTWDFTGVSADDYSVSVEVWNGRERVGAQAKVTVTNCACETFPKAPIVTMNCPNEADCNEPVNFTVSLSEVTPGMKLTYTWSLSAGRIVSGQGTPSISALLEPGSAPIASVEIGGLPPGSARTFSCTSSGLCPRVVRRPRLVDEYVVTRHRKRRRRRRKTRRRTMPKTALELVLHR